MKISKLKKVFLIKSFYCAKKNVYTFKDAAETMRSMLNCKSYSEELLRT